MDGKIVNLAKKIVRYKEHLLLYNDCEDRKLLPQGLYKESSVTFEDKNLRDVLLIELLTKASSSRNV